MERSASSTLYRRDAEMNYAVCCSKRTRSTGSWARTAAETGSGTAAWLRPRPHSSSRSWTWAGWCSSANTWTRADADVVPHDVRQTLRNVPCWSNCASTIPTFWESLAMAN